MDYNLPLNPFEMTIRQIRFFYDPMIDGLAKIQREQKERENGK